MELHRSQATQGKRNKTNNKMKKVTAVTTKPKTPITKDSHKERQVSKHKLRCGGTTDGEPGH